MRQAQDQLSRREWFRYAGVFAGGAMVARAAAADVWAQAQTAADPLDERRAQMGAAPIVTNRLGAESRDALGARWQRRRPSRP